MPAQPEFIQHLAEQLQPLGSLRARSMFGGWGLYLDGLFFAIVADDELYVKADAINREVFIAAGSLPFTYGHKDGGSTTLNYYRVGSDVLDDRETLLQWARLAIEAALRAARRKAGKAPAIED